jgi:hypothetical protein
VGLAILPPKANGLLYLFPHKQHEVTFRVCVMDSASERNRFLVLIEMGNSFCTQVCCGH